MFVLCGSARNYFFSQSRRGAEPQRKSFKAMCLIRIILLLALPSCLFAQVPNIWEDQRAQIDLANFLEMRLVPGYNFESDVTFSFAKGDFPQMELSSPATAKQFLGGDYSIDIRWFDTDLKEVKKPLQPGRYAYYAEILGSNGITMRRAGTLFCTPKDWMGWSEEIKAYINYFPFDQVPKNIWVENKEAISGYAGKILLASMLNQYDGAILLSFIHEMNRRGLKPGPLQIPTIMDGDYHVRLKQKVLGLEDKFSALEVPKQVDSTALTLKKLEPGARAKYAIFEKEMFDLCEAWAAESREPFDMLISKEGEILFHHAFGKNLRGIYRTSEATEIASITKLITGLLFAQFMDQDLIQLEDHVGKYLPDFAVEGEAAITLRQCFTHTTGFVGHGAFGGVQNPWLDNALALWLPHIKVGTYHWYNGMGYDLAGKVMEMVAGKSVFHLMHKQLFEPLQLEHTYNDIDLAWGVKSTAYDLGIIGQMLLNKGQFGNTRFFSEAVYESMLPTDLESYFPKVKNKHWGVGLTSMNTYIEDVITGEKRAILSDQMIGHGSATSSILRIDPQHNIVIAQSRMDAGKGYEAYVKKMLLLIEKHLVE